MNIKAYCNNCGEDITNVFGHICGVNRGMGIIQPQPEPNHIRPVNNPLTKRERFAMAAMQGLLACSETKGTAEKFASEAVSYADALIAELNK